jgi:hypothetical protein
MKFFVRYTLGEEQIAALKTFRERHNALRHFYEVGPLETIEEANAARERIEARGYRAIVEAREPEPDVPWELPCVS